MEMESPAQSIEFSNRTKMTLMILVEPQGEDYCVNPGQKLTLRYYGSDLQVEWSGDVWGGLAAVVISGLADGQWAFYEGERKVESGHNQPQPLRIL